MACILTGVLASVAAAHQTDPVREIVQRRLGAGENLGTLTLSAHRSPVLCCLVQ